MAQSLVDQHPDVTTITWKFNRWQHQVNYSGFRRNRLVRKPESEIQTGINEYGMKLVDAEQKSCAGADDAS